VDRIAVPQHHAQAVRLVVHDYVGHPFQVHLSRHLAKRGHEVSHIYFADHPGPKGSFENQPNDPPSLRFIGITLGGSAEHAAGSGAQTGFARRFGDVAYGREVARVIQGFKPDVVLSGNTPTEAQRAILRSCKSRGVGFVYWVQDIYSMAVTKYLSERLGYPGKAIGWYYQWLDRCQFRDSDAIIVISEDFAPLVGSWAGNDNKVSVIENWAAIDDLPSGLKDNDWSRDHSLHSDLAFVYSGTLGRKHSPMLLLRLAQACRAGESVVVAGQGFGIPQLQAAKTEHRIDALKLLPIQPARHLADVLATADVLVATIEADAGAFAIPSKVLSYLCAGRPILLAAPRDNLAARTVERANAGIVVDPADEAGFMAAAGRLRADPELRAELGANGRAYAERTFDMTRITDRFERVILNVRLNPQLETAE
jgi:colanic acid biosynthesis glycosyl transferase WcaI